MILFILTTVFFFKAFQQGHALVWFEIYEADATVFKIIAVNVVFVVVEGHFG